MTPRQRIDRSREGRLWISQVILPVIMTVVTIKSNPNLENWFRGRWTKVKDGFKVMFGK